MDYVPRHRIKEESVPPPPTLNPCQGYLELCPKHVAVSGCVTPRACVSGVGGEGQRLGRALTPNMPANTAELASVLQCVWLVQANSKLLPLPREEREHGMNYETIVCF